MLTPSQILAIRVATDADAADLHRLTRLDQRRLPKGGSILLGVVDGEPRAAISVESGTVVSDPFHPTADLVALLRLRASRLKGELPVEAGARAARVRALLPRIRRLSSTA